MSEIDDGWLFISCALTTLPPVGLQDFIAYIYAQ